MEFGLRVKAVPAKNTAQLPTLFALVNALQAVGCRGMVAYAVHQIGQRVHQPGSAGTGTEKTRSSVVLRINGFSASARSCCVVQTQFLRRSQQGDMKWARRIRRLG